MVSCSINSQKRSPFICVIESAGHKCRVPIHILPGTDVRTLDMERPATLVAIGKSDQLGLHLDSGEARAAITGEKYFHIEPVTSLTVGAHMYAERCGGACGGEITDPAALASAPPSPAASSASLESVTSLVSEPEGLRSPAPSFLPPLWSPVLSRSGEIHGTTAVAVTQARKAKSELRGLLSSAQRVWAFTPTFNVFLNSESADFYMQLYRGRHRRVPGVLSTTLFMHAVRGAFGPYLPDDCEIRVTIRHGPGDHTYFDVQSFDDLGFVMFNLDPDLKAIAALVPRDSEDYAPIVSSNVEDPNSEAEDSEAEGGEAEADGAEADAGEL